MSELWPDRPGDKALGVHDHRGVGVRQDDDLRPTGRAALGSLRRLRRRLAAGLDTSHDRSHVDVRDPLGRLLGRLAVGGPRRRPIGPGHRPPRTGDARPVRGAPARKWVGEIDWLLLDCSDDLRQARIEARPPWRSRDVDEKVSFGRWLRNNLAEQVNTDQISPEETAEAVAGWILGRLRAIPRGDRAF